jgi:uncharacterized protein (TIGR02284 family)
MARSTDDYISCLNDLIETCKDGEQGYRDSADNVQRADLRTLFSEYARQRAQFASELQRHVIRLGGDATTTGSATGAVHRGWVNLKSAITGRDDSAILQEVESGEDAAVKEYQDALAEDLPTDLRSVIEEQYRQILDAHNRMRSLRDATEAGVTTETPVTRRVV